MKMEKLKKAAKRVTAVAVSAAIVGSYAFAGGLSSYPKNFVNKDNKFVGKVVVGASADAMDTTSANSIIEDLKAEFSGDVQKVKIIYRTSSSGGSEINAVRDNEQLNYGERLGSVTESGGFDDRDSSLLADGRFKNGVSDEDYEQTLKLDPGDKVEFNHALWDNVDGVDKITDGIYLPDGTEFAEYALDMKSEIDLRHAENKDFIGKTLTIMGNEFTIGDINFDNSSNKLTKLVLLGGAHKISLGEGETTSVTVDGKTYEIKVQSVSSDKVLLTVNGETKSLDEYDSDEVGGVNIAVTDLISSSRDSVKGYAEFVVGGQKITLEDNDAKVKVNDEDIDDVYEKYKVYSDFDGSGFDKIIIKYKVADDTLLKAGDSLEDVLFQAFRLEYDGTNNPEYTKVKVSVDDDDVKIEGKTEKGEDLTLKIHSDSSGASAGKVYIKGDQDEDRIFVRGSDLHDLVASGINVDTSDVLSDVTPDVTIDTQYDIINGGVDINENTSVDTSDDGYILVKDGSIYKAVQVIDGKLDIDGSGTVNDSDDASDLVIKSSGTDKQVDIINGQVDVDGSGVGDSDDLSDVTPNVPIDDKYDIINGEVDITQSDGVNDDDGYILVKDGSIYKAVQVIDGKLDTDGSGTVDNSDDASNLVIKSSGTDKQVDIINGKVDVDESGIIGDYIVFDLTSTNIKGSGFLLTKDSEEQYLYEITSVDTSDANHEVDFDEWLRGDDEKDIKISEWGTKLGMTLDGVSNTNSNVKIPISELGNVIAFENNILMNLQDADDTDRTLSSSAIYIGLDKEDVSADDSAEEADTIKISLGWDIKDKEFDISGLEYYKNVEENPTVVGTGAFVNDGKEDAEDGSSDVKEYVTRYGIKVVYDNEEQRSAEIYVPEKQVKANVKLIFGGEGADTLTTYVDKDKVEEKKSELEEKGYTIVKVEDVPASNVEFDVSSVVLDTEVSSLNDLIVVGGPAVNRVARELLGIENYTVDQAGVAPGEGIIRYYEDKNSVLVYGYSKEDTAAAVSKLNEGGLSGDVVNVK